MSKGYFKEVLSIVQSVLILAKIFGYSNLSWPQTFVPTALYVIMWLLAGMIVAPVTGKKMDDKEHRRNIGTTSVNEFTDDGK